MGESGKRKGSAMAETIVKLRSSKSVGPDEVNAAIQQIWDELADDPDLRHLTEGAENPFQARRTQAQIGVAETIAIAAATKLAQDAVSAVWKDYVWPALKRRFGAKLKAPDDGQQG